MKLHYRIITLLFCLIILDQTQAIQPGSFDLQKPSDMSDVRWSSLKTAVQETKLLPSPVGIGGGGGQFGSSVSIDGNRALIGGSGLVSSGAAVVFEFDGTAWSEVARLTPSDGQENDLFGFSVSLSGNRALVGAPRADLNGNFNAGSAYVYEFNGFQWTEVQKIVSSDFNINEFGFSVSLSGDRALIGSYNSEIAYIFDFDGGHWVESQELVPTVVSSSEEFGYSVSLLGTRAIVGAPGRDLNGNSFGSVYIFDLQGDQWNETTKLIALNGEPLDQFGCAVSLTQQRVLVGACKDDEAGENAGSAYIFDFIGEQWIQSQKLLPSPNSDFSGFGRAVSVSGNRAVIGALDAVHNGIVTGTATVFEFENGVWVRTQELNASNSTEFDHFANSVSISDDNVLVGADLFSENNEGTAYVFELSGNLWLESQQLSLLEGASFGLFGNVVEISGNRAFIGAPDDDVQRGAVYVFEFDAGYWHRKQKLKASDGMMLNSFGYSLSSFGNYLFIGAYESDFNGTNSGSVYVFEMVNGVWSEIQRLAASDGSAGVFFGNSVSLYGDIAVIGAFKDRINGVHGAGSAYIFENNGSSWVETQKLSLIQNVLNGGFGYSVSISNDVILVGAHHGDAFNESIPGSVYYFEKQQSLWKKKQELKAMDAHDGDKFGYAVSLAGNQALIGAVGNNNTGAAYVFLLANNTWSQEQKLITNDTQNLKQFGNSVSLLGDRALIGDRLWGASGAGTSAGTGAAFLFKFLNDSWIESDQFIPIDGAIHDSIGSSVNLSEDRILIGAPYDDENGVSSGSAYVFTLPLFNDGFEGGSVKK